VADDDAAVLAAVRDAGLLPHANVFFLQRYGFAAHEAAWDPPFAVADRFTLVNPDGSAHGTDLVGRSEAMRALP
ncbi:MAG: radical SAM protein, partial [Myxococcota bacterium]